MSGIRWGAHNDWQACQIHSMGSLRSCSGLPHSGCGTPLGLGQIVDSQRKDSLILQKPSPDGKLVAEIHTFTTAMWGGPDTLYVAIRQSDRSEPEKVYSRTYECGDFSAFGLEWETPEELTIKYGECNPSPFAHTPAENAKENKIWQQETSWNGVTIRYDDARREATR